MDFYQFLASVLGAGLTVALVNWLKETRSALRTREIAHLHDQLKLLYGPLHFVAKQNAQIFKLQEQVDEAYTAEFANRVPSTDEGVRLLSEQAMQVIDLKNLYGAKLVENNGRMAQVLESNWNLVDFQDEAFFSQFLEEYLRWKAEREHEAAKGSLPLVIKMKMAPVYLYRTEFVAELTTRWHRKRQRMDKLLMPTFWQTLWLKASRFAREE